MLALSQSGNETLHMFQDYMNLMEFLACVGSLLSHVSTAC